MKKGIGFLLVIIVAACSNNNTPFEKKGWLEKKNFLYTKREFMVSDLMVNYKFKGMKTKQLFEMLGKPDSGDPNKFYYTITETLEQNIDPVYIKSLVFIVNVDSVITDYKVEEFKK
ncbi:MAG TPA: hypothetical protein DGG95_06540 [Cytophagales bacterium]|jgi:hypothetical protein|nr:hypothetical protein [Cytophagales bacterium]